MDSFTFTLDGQRHDVTTDSDMPLLYALKGDLELKGPKFGCGLAQCGACTVIMDGAAVRSCITPMSAADGREIRTLDGLGTADAPHPVQKAFMEEEAAQCGYCTNGWIMTAVAALERNPNVTDSDVRQMLSDLQCRCGAHMAMLRAVRKAADEMAGEEGDAA